jgi:ubiquinone/menaquinone biosynthesis C-methylase UbiE
MTAYIETERVRRLQDKQAPKYDRQMRFFERVLFGGGREWVCSRAAGEILEIAVGTGRNLGHYSPGTRLTGIELSAQMLAIAERRATDADVDADLRLGDAQALEFADSSFDTVVCTLALCTIPDDAKAVAEVRRVLRPGGRFLLLEHVRSPVIAVRIGERLIEPLSVRFGADHLTASRSNTSKPKALRSTSSSAPSSGSSSASPRASQPEAKTERGTHGAAGTSAAPWG